MVGWAMNGGDDDGGRFWREGFEGLTEEGGGILAGAGRESVIIFNG